MKFTIPIAKPLIDHNETKAVNKAISSGWITMGRKVEEFEKKICALTKSKYSVAVNNGTSALDSILKALSIGPGDEVIVPSLTYISTSNVVLYNGAKLILCDNDPDTFNVTVKNIEKKITKKTKAFITVDLKGTPVDYEKFKKLSIKHKIYYISDSAESFGAKYKKKIIGTQADIHSFSFFANKNITTGEGGAVTTNNKKIYEKLKIIRNQGQDKRYNHVVLGNNYRMTDLCASIGITQLKKINRIIQQKNKLAKIYTKELKKNKNITPPFIPDYATQPSWYMYSIKVKKKFRNKLINFLKKNNIDTRLSFPPVHIQPYYVKKFKFKRSQFVNAINSYDSFVDIPIWYGMKKKTQYYIIKKLNAFFKK
jgi:dTDP-4-amino-4,6-dideoxygalactose transaminase